MNTAVTEAQVRKYREDGYVKIDQLLDPGEVAELKSAVLEAVRLRLIEEAPQVAFWREAVKNNQYGRAFTQTLNLWRQYPTIKRYMLGPELGVMACRLAGVAGMRVWHDQALIKEPFGNPTAFHLDNPYWSFTSSESISVWIALENATIENGCMWFVPGSHRLARSDNVLASNPNFGGLFLVYPEMGDIDPVPVPMKAGDCSFHNGLCAHGAGPNITRRRRLAMTCAYMPEGSAFNGNANILPRDYLQTLKVGDVLANDEWNPVVGRT